MRGCLVCLVCACLVCVLACTRECVDIPNKAPSAVRSTNVRWDRGVGSEVVLGFEGESVVLLGVHVEEPPVESVGASLLVVVVVVVVAVVVAVVLFCGGCGGRASAVAVSVSRVRRRSEKLETT